MRKSKKIAKLRVTGLCVGNSPLTGEFPAQMASNVENVSIWWRHHDGRPHVASGWYPTTWVAGDTLRTIHMLHVWIIKSKPRTWYWGVLSHNCILLSLNAISCAGYLLENISNIFNSFSPLRCSATIQHTDNVTAVKWKYFVLTLLLAAIVTTTKTHKTMINRSIISLYISNELSYIFQHNIPSVRVNL